MTTTEPPANPPEPGPAPSVSDAGVNADAIGLDTESDLLADALTPTPTPEQETATLRAALADANAEIARQQDAVQRGRADLANARRRHDEERIGIRQQANSGLLVRLLPIVDELDLAVTHLETGGNGAAAAGVSVPVPGPGADPASASASASWIEGVRLIQRKLASFLEGEGVTRIAALGETFNPERHEAVGMAQVDGAASGCIVEVVRQGYLLHDRVVQAAQVVVNR